MVLARRFGLGLLVGAVFHSVALAQVRDTTRTKRDTVRSPTDTITGRRDSTVKRDTSRAVRVAVPAREDSLLRRDSLVRRDSARVAVRDTVKPPLTTAEAPVLADPSGSFVWDRRDVFSTGALTVQDLLERVPGVTTLRSGWISQPMVGAFLGDPGRVRVFLDGLELEELDPRMRSTWDLTQIPLWALDDIRVERGVSEVRIYMRSWRVDRTTPYTRTDIYSGDQNTNLYRGLFGRRYQHGEAVQIAGQQYGTNPGRNSESSDQLGVLVRVGIAKRGWSADAMLLRNDRNRGRTLAETAIDTIPAIENTRTDAYARFGWGTSDKGPWVQGLASASKYAYGGKRSGTATSGTRLADTTRYRSQYVLTGGYALGPLHASFTQRYRAGLFQRIATPSARVGMDTRRFSASVFAEGRGLDSARRLDASAVVRPLGFVFVAGAIGNEQPRADSAAMRRYMRGEAGLRLWNTWISGGMLRRDEASFRAPTIFHRAARDTTETSAQGVFGTIRGRVWKAVYVDAQGIQWSDTGSFYRPRYQTRSELYVSTSLLGRFPSGNFHLLASAIHEYRSSSLWPDAAGPVRTQGYRTISTLLQVRIVTAEVFWNFRNVLAERYAHVPGYPLPRQTQVYGVRWEFWN